MMRIHCFDVMVFAKASMANASVWENMGLIYEKAFTLRFVLTHRNFAAFNPVKYRTMVAAHGLFYPNQSLGFLTAIQH